MDFADFIRLDVFVDIEQIVYVARIAPFKRRIDRYPQIEEMAERQIIQRADIVKIVWIGRVGVFIPAKQLVDIVGAQLCFRLVFCRLFFVDRF